MALAISCSAGDDIVFSFEDRASIDFFPESYQLHDGETVIDSLTGVIDLVIKDCGLLLSSVSGDSGYVSAYSYDGKEYQGSLFEKGRAGGEFLSPKSFGALGLTNGPHNSIGCTVDGNGDLIRIDFAQSFESGHPVFEVFWTKPTVQAPKMFVIDSSKILVKDIDRYFTGFDRYVINSDRGISSIPDIDGIARARVGDDSRVNVLTTLLAYNANSGIAVEAGVQVGAIHLYSLSGDFAKTLIISHEANVSDVLRQADSKIRDQFVHLCAYDDFFAAMYCNATEREQASGLVRQSVLVFDWDGHPLCRYNLDIQASSFDFDIGRQRLYVLDPMDERIVSYCLSDMWPVPTSKDV